MGLNRKQLADLAGIDSVSVYRLDDPVDNYGRPRGFRISLRTVMRLAQALEVDITDLTGTKWRD